MAALTAMLSMVASRVSAYEATTINDGWSFRFQNDSIASPVHIPHSWNEDAYSTRNYKRGAGTYSKSLIIPQHLNGRRIYLRFDGAATKSTIAIDGNDIGSHVGAYSSHTLDITPYVTPGQTHNLTVTVDNADPEIPPHSADFTFMGGLYRDAWLINSAPIHMDFSDGPAFKVNTCANPNGTWAAKITAKILNSTEHAESITMDVSLRTSSGELIASRSDRLKVRSGGNPTETAITLDNIKDIIPWSPESPELYDLTVNLKKDGQIIDTTTEKTGFRTFGFDREGRFMLNGKPYKLRGMNRHQDQKPMGIALQDEQHRRDMQILKEMGANFIRISHYPQDDAILEMCDRLGFIAWEEIPVINYVIDSNRYADNAETMLREMIRNHYNHPSVVMWGYMNEILLTMPHDEREIAVPRTIALADRLENIVREEDPSRLTAMAFHGSDIYNQTGVAEITDVKGWNLYSGWYGGGLSGFEDYLSRQHREHPDHKLIVSEYGAGSDLRIHTLTPKAFDFSMEYQQDYLEHYLPVIEDSAFVAGAAHWNLIDFSSANRAESMPYINNKGILTNDRRKKDVFYYYKSAWHDINDTVAYIATRDWPMRTEIIDESGYVSRPIKVYTNLPVVEMSVNGVSYGVKSVDNYNAVFDVNLEAGNNVIEIADANNPGKILDAHVVNISPIHTNEGKINPATSEIAINVGSNCYFRSDDSGLTWLPDRQYNPGSIYGHIGGKEIVTQDVITLTNDDPLLQHAVSGLDEYRIDIVPGRYEVELSFAELSSPSEVTAYLLGHNSGSGGKSPANMDITINGKCVEKGLSPQASTGVKSMVKRRYFAEVTDNSGLCVQFTPSEGGSTLLSAIKIRKL